MKRRLAVSMLALSMLLFAATTQAAPIFDFSYSGAGVTASGQLTTNDLSGGTFLITAISGDRNGVPITGLSTFNLANNLLYPDPPFVDFFGLSYVAGGISFNLFLFGGQLVEIPNTCCSTSPIGLSVTPADVVPEPATLALVGLGLGGLVLRRRRPTH